MRDSWQGGGGWSSLPMEGPGRGGAPLTEGERLGCLAFFLLGPIIIAVVALLVALGGYTP
jgi:hypothetical protein